MQRSKFAPSETDVRLTFEFRRRCEATVAWNELLGCGPRENEVKNALDLIVDAMECRGNRRKLAWTMARASYACSRSHGLTRWEALRGAVDLWRDYTTRPNGQIQRAP